MEESCGLDHFGLSPDSKLEHAAGVAVKALEALGLGDKTKCVVLVEEVQPDGTKLVGSCCGGYENVLDIVQRLLDTARALMGENKDQPDD